MVTGNSAAKGSSSCNTRRYSPQPNALSAALIAWSMASALLAASQHHRADS